MKTKIVHLGFGIFANAKQILLAATSCGTICFSQQAFGHRDTYVQASYAFTLNMTQSIEELESSYSLGYDVRLLSFLSRVLAITNEYNSSKSSRFQRTAYQQTRIGVQYYPLGLGVDFQSTYESVIINYSSRLKPYFAASLGFGRFLIKPQSSEKDGFEQSVDHVILGGAVGAHIHFSPAIAADVAADTGYVLSNSALALSGVVVRARAGVMVAL